MTDKEKIREEIEKKLELMQYQVHRKDAYKELKDVLTYIDSMQEEPVSEDLGLYINELSKQFPEVSFAKLSRIAVRVAKWQKEQMMSKAIDFIIVDNNAISTEISTFPYVSLGTEGDTVKLIIINQD